MANKPKDPTPPRKLTRTAVRKGVAAQHENIVGAVHRVLKKAGLKDVTIHSLRLAMPQDFDDPCDGKCNPDTEQCVLDNNGGHVKWVCVPK